jgi:hypothetical protein
MSNPNDEVRDADPKKVEDAMKGFFDLFKQKYTNTPESLDAAIERIRELELRLEDLARGVEIAVFTRQFDLVDGFVNAANEALKTKMVEDYENTTKVTFVGPGENVNINIGIDENGKLDAQVQRT